MYEVGVARTFHALHQLEAEGPGDHDEHSHDYRAEVVARASELDESSMVVDLDLLAAAVAECLSELDSVELDALPAFAGRNTTVETVADHVWHHVRERLGPPSTLAGLRVTVYESPDAWASVDRPVHDGA